MEFTKTSGKKQLISDIHVDESLNPRIYYNPTEMEELEESVKNSGVTSPFLSMRRVNYKGDNPKEELVDGFRRRRILMKLKLDKEEQKFIIYSIDFSKFETNEDAEKYFAEEKARIIGTTQETSKLTPIEYGLIVNQLLQSNPKITTARLKKLLNRSDSRVSEYKKLGKVMEKEEIYNAYRQGILTSENVKSFLKDNERRIDDTKECIMNFLNAENNTTNSSNKVNESDFEEKPVPKEVDEDEDDENEEDGHTADESILGVQIQDNSFSVNEFTAFLYRINGLKVSQTKLISKLVNSFIHNIPISNEFEAEIEATFNFASPEYHKKNEITEKTFDDVIFEDEEPS